MMNLKLWSLGCLFVLSMGQASAEKVYKYRVSLKDKVGTTCSIDKPEEFLSERALERRNRQQLSIDETDLPVSGKYVDELKATGARLVTTSKWNNTVVLEVSDTLLMEEISKKSFVTGVKKVWVSPDSIPPRNMKRKKEVKNKVEKTGCHYGNALRQIEIHGGDSLHTAGFVGKGMHVAVIDAGFYNADEIKFFRKMDLLGTRDFVNPNSDIYAENAHGLMVLSCMAANLPKVFVGTAPEASYWLLRSEDNDSEQPIEEDYWAAAIEFAKEGANVCLVDIDAHSLVAVQKIISGMGSKASTYVCDVSDEQRVLGVVQEVLKEYGKIDGIRPDYYDGETIYELKPYNPRAAKQGVKQLKKYCEKIPNWRIARLEFY